MSRYDVVLLDADETLFDFRRSEAEALAETFHRRGFSWEGEEQRRYHQINRALWDSFDRGEIAREWLTEERFARWQRETMGRVEHDPRRWNEDFQQALGCRPYLLPGALELCQRLYGRAELYIVTNGLVVAQGRVRISPLWPYLEKMFVSQTMGCQKPHREFFDQVFAALGLTEEDKGRVLMVGDNLISDIKGGADYGLDTVWVRWPGKAENPAVYPTYTITQLDQLERIVCPEG